MKKRKLHIFEFSNTPKGATQAVENMSMLRVLTTSSVDESLKEAKQLLEKLGLSNRVRSINIAISGDVHAILEKNPQPSELTNWTWRRPR